MAWYEREKLVHSGWGWGQSNLQGGVVAIEANLGNGHVFLFGPEITFRGEPHATFPFLFNAIYYSEARAYARELLTRQPRGLFCAATIRISPTTATMPPLIADFI